MTILWLWDTTRMSVVDEQRSILMDRTNTQNKSLHKYFDLLANALNAAGLDMKTVLKPEIDIPWTKDNVKNHLWRPVQDAFVNKESTTELSTVEIGEIYKVLDRHLSEKHGIHIEWPSLERQYNEANYNGLQK